MLPTTRPQVFWDVLKLHWFDLLRMGLLLIAAFAPILVNALLPDFYTMRLYAELPQDTSAEALQSVQLAASSFRSTSALISIPLYLIFAAVLSGAARVIRQYAYEEIVFYRRDLALGIKQNWKHYVLLALLLGVQGFFGVWLSGTGSMTVGYAIGTVGAIYNVLLLVVFLPVLAYMLVLTAVYSNTFFQNLKLGFALYAKTIPMTLLTMLGCGICYLISVIPNFYCHLFGRLIGTLLLPVSFLIWTLFVLSNLDKYVNPRFFPEMVGKGLYRPQTESAGENTEEGDSVQDARA